MNKLNLIDYIIPAYLAIVLFIQINLTIINVIFVSLPIFVILISIYLKNKKIGVIGLFLFYILSLSTVVISNISDYFQIIMQIIFLILPSIILIGQILEIENEKQFKPALKPFILSILLFLIVLIVFYLICLFLLDGLLISQHYIEAQILILTALSIICCLPFLITQKVRNKNI